MDALRNLRVGTRLALAFAVLLALMLIMAAVGALQARSINSYAEFYPEDILPSLRVLHQIDANLGEVRGLEAQHVLTDDDKDKQAIAARIAKARDAVTKSLKDYEALAVDDTDRAHLKRVGEQALAYLALDEKLRKASDDSASDPTQGTAAREMLFGSMLTDFNTLRDSTRQWWDYNEKLAAAATASGEAAYRRVLWVFALATLVALAIGITAALTITRSIVEPIRRASESVRAVAAGDLTQRVSGSTRDELGTLLTMLDEMTQNLARMVSGVRTGCEQINGAAAEIAQGNGDLSARTESQASSLEETAASVEQMAAQIRANADNARQADQLAHNASEVAQAGGAAVGEVVKTMDAISASSRKIGDIIGVIDGIAFQTNILALNAAVEAARAGEQGRGFAVVAGEVRNLAQRSAEAAKEIKSLIGDSVTKVESGSSQVLAARETIDRMVSEVRKVTELVGEITVSSREQSEGVTQINAAVSQLDQTTQQNAALVEQTAAAAQSMRQQTGRLTDAVSAFRVDARPAAPRPAPATKPVRAAAPAAARPVTPARPRPPVVKAPAARAAPAPGAAAPRPAAAPVAEAATTAEDNWVTF
jgi:methyl-accepting chemotaxis protein